MPPLGSLRRCLAFCFCASWPLCEAIRHFVACGCGAAWDEDAVQSGGLRVIIYAKTVYRGGRRAVHTVLGGPRGRFVVHRCDVRAFV